MESHIKDFKNVIKQGERRREKERFVARLAEDGRGWEHASDDKGFDGKTNISKQKRKPHLF